MDSKPLWLLPLFFQQEISFLKISSFSLSCGDARMNVWMNEWIVNEAMLFITRVISAAAAGPLSDCAAVALERCASGRTTGNIPTSFNTRLTFFILACDWRVNDTSKMKRCQKGPWEHRVKLTSSHVSKAASMHRRSPSTLGRPSWLVLMIQKKILHF